MAVMIRDVLAQPAPERLDGHQIRTVPRQRHQFDVQRAGDLPDGLGPVIGRAVPQHDQLAIGPFGPQPSKNLDGVLAVGAREGPQPHLTFVVEIKPIEGEIKPIEGDACGQTGRGGGNPYPWPALPPAVAEIAILMDVRLIEKDQQMLVALGAVQHALELLDKRLSPLRIGPAEQLLGLLPRQLAAVQGRADRLAAAPQAEALADPADQTAQGPAWRWISPFDGRSGCPALGGAARITKRCCDLRAKGGRPPVRRKTRASGPRSF